MMENTSRLGVASRFVAAIGGGYLFAYGFVALATLAGFGAGLRFFEAQSLALMLSFFAFLGAILWGFADRSIARVWVVLVGGGAGMCLLSYALSRAIG